MMKDKLARATWSFKGHGALSDVDTTTVVARIRLSRQKMGAPNMKYMIA